MSVEDRTRATLAATARTIDPDTESMLTSVETTIHRQDMRRRALLGAGLVAVLVGVGAVGVVWGTGVLGSETGQGEVQPVEQPVDSDGGWVRVEDPDLEDSRGLNVVREIDGRLVAVGRGEVPILTSTDGIEWTPADTPAAYLWDAIPGGPGLIAYGATSDERPAVWTSTDGLTWTPVEDPDGAFDAPNSDGPYSGVIEIVAGGPGFVAIGMSDDRPTVWTSPDGLDWTAEHLSSRKGSMWSVTHGGPGLIVRGWVDDDSPPEYRRNAAWTSADGVSWTLAPEWAFDEWGEPDPSRASIKIAAGPGFVAIGWKEDGPNNQTLVWTSDDGETWTPVPNDEHGLDGGVSEVIDLGGEFMALGRRGISAAAWTSTDGVTWEPTHVESFADLDDIRNVIQTGSRLVAVGAADYNDQMPVDNYSGAVWVMDVP